jgi:hypothetical protein
MQKDNVIQEINHENAKGPKSLRSQYGESDSQQMGYFGNIWVRSHFFHKAGDSNGGGHVHHFDHVTLLAVGSVLVEVEGHEPKEFHAPTFIIIKKEHKHRFTALTDGVVYYCVYAFRDEDGQLRGEDGRVLDIYENKNSPYNEDSDPEIKEKLKELEEKTTKEH